MKARSLWGLAAAALLCCGCSKQTYLDVDIKYVEESMSRETDSETVSRETLPQPQVDPNLPEYYLPQERVLEDGQVLSYLTGEPTDPAQADRRPVAVMMSNDKEALPQYGINRAGVVYEAPVEGGMCRYLAILEDYDSLERIGSVRSCRTYYIYFAKEFDAVYAHYGQSTFAKPYLKYIDNLNGLEGIGNTVYYRSSDKKRPHNAYTSGSRLNQGIRQMGYSHAYDQDYQGHYLFARQSREDRLANRPGVMEAAKAVPGYASNQAYFQYDPSDGLYYRFQYGDRHMGDEGQIAVKNLIFQGCQQGYYASTEYLNINVQAPEYGYFITGGLAIPIHWEKEDEWGVTHYYDTDNQEIVLNPGKTWVCIIPTRDFERIEIAGN